MNTLTVFASAVRHTCKCTAIDIKYCFKGTICCLQSRSSNHKDYVKYYLRKYLCHCVHVRKEMTTLKQIAILMALTENSSPSA